MISQQRIEAWLVGRVAELLGESRASIDPHSSFEAYGLDSAAAAGLAGDLEARLQRQVPVTIAFERPSIRAVAEHLAGSRPPATERARRSSSPWVEGRMAEPIAVVGIGCRFPAGADRTSRFWQRLVAGADMTTDVTDDRWPAGWERDSPEGTWQGIRRGGFLDDVESFDADYFGIAPREARRADPQQLLLLEVAQEALDDAGLTRVALSRATAGVFIGASTFDFALLQLARAEDLDPYCGTGSALSVAANRLSFTFDLRGPSLTIDTACSSSLVALWSARQALLDGQCDLALVGGVNLMLSPTASLCHAQLGVLSPEGRCRAFDAAADGFVRGEGAGILVLKRLGKAQADRDLIYATVEGGAVNSDGRSNGLTAPNGVSQRELLARALADASCRPDEIQYVEAHGTGTPLGDPIELSALGDVLADRALDDTCLVGSVKTNAGHLEAAAGMASVVKVCLALVHGEIPPSLNYSEPNPAVDLERLPLQIADRHQPWPDGKERRLAGVSSFGFGGTNAHMVLGAPPDDLRRTPRDLV